EPPLVVEQQALVGPAGDEVQRMPVALQGLLRAHQRIALGAAEQPFPDHRVEVRRIRDAPAQPAHEVQRAQSAWTFLQVWLEVVGGVVEAREALRLLLALGFEEGRRRPYRRVREQGIESRSAA